MQLKILVAIDESPCSDAALEALMSRTWKPDTEVLVLTVIQPMTSQFTLSAAFVVGPLIENNPDVIELRKKLVADKVLGLKAIFAKDLLFGKVAEGDPADVILETAKSWNADLVLVGSHGRKGLKRFLLGSVAEKVAKNSECSVEIVRHKFARKSM